MIVQAKAFVMVRHSGKPTLRFAIANVWKPNRLESPRLLHSWRSIGEPILKLVPLDIDRIQKVTTLFVPETIQDDDLDGLDLQCGEKLWTIHLSKTCRSSGQRKQHKVEHNTYVITLHDI